MHTIRNLDILSFQFIHMVFATLFQYLVNEKQVALAGDRSLNMMISFLSIHIWII